jgi:PAS domain S-box-containing protein
MSDATLIEANNAFEKLTGYMHGAWKGKSTLQLGLWTFPEQRGVFIDALKRDGSIRDFACNIRDRDSISRHCLLNAALFTIHNDQYLFVILRDVTQQRLLEEQKAEADHALLRLAQGTHSGTGESFFASLVNDLASALRTDCAFIGLRDVDNPDLMHTLAICLRGDQVDNLDYVIPGSPCERTLHGEIAIFASDIDELFSQHTVFAHDRWDSYAGAPLHNAHGEVIGVLVAMHDKPLRNPDLVRSLLQVFSERASAELERKRAEEELRLSEQRFATIFHSTPVPMFVTQLSDDNVIKDINSAFENLFLHARKNVIGKSTQDLAIYANPQDRHTLLKELKTTGKIENHEEVWMLRGDGAKILIHFSCNIFSFDNEQFAIFSCQDVTEKRLIEQEIRELNSTLEDRVIERTEELQQANQELETTLDALNLAQAELVNSEKLAALGALVAGISHELNTPIGNSLMVASTLHDQTTSLLDAYQENQGIKRSSLESYLADTGKAGDILTRNLQRAADLVNSFKQVAIDQISSQRREFTLSEVVNEILLTLWPMIRKSPYTVEQNIPENIRFDSYPGPLGQVLTNLINNALLHGFEGKKHGDVQITARLDAQNLVELTVRDDGIGIPADRLRKIFDPFFTTKLGAGGSGLGLNITHNIVTGVLGGRIRVSSAIDVGTSFVMLLPLVAPAKKGSDDILHP